MSHGGMGGHGGQGGHGGSGHHSGQGQHGAYGHQASQHAPSDHIPNPYGQNHHGSYADSTFVHHGAPGGHARGSGRGVSGAAHSIGGAYGQIAGTFLSAVAHVFGLGSPGGHHGHAPAGAPPGTHSVNGFPSAAMADRKPQASPIASQSQRALDNAQAFKRKKLIEFGFYSLAMVVILGLYLCVVSATRQAELQRKAETGIFPSARYGAQMAQYDQPQASNQPAIESRSTFTNQQASYAGQSIGINAASSADYTSAFGSARSGAEENKPSGSWPQAVGSELNRPLSESLRQPAFQQRLQNVSEAGVYQVNNALARTSGFPYKQRFELPGELAGSQPDRFATGAPSGNIAGGFPVRPYAQSDGSGPYSQAPQYPGYAQQSAWPPRGSDPGLDGGLNPRRLAPRIVVVGR